MSLPHRLDRLERRCSPAYRQEYWVEERAPSAEELQEMLVIVHEIGLSEDLAKALGPDADPDLVAVLRTEAERAAKRKKTRAAGPR